MTPSIVLWAKAMAAETECTGSFTSSRPDIYAFMLALLGISLVFAAVFGGYLLEKGNPWVLLQPAELLIIGGAAIGIILVANPPAVIRKMLRGLREAFHSPKYTRAGYLVHLRMLFEVFSFARRSGGMIALESDLDDPASSPIFSNY